MSVWMMRGARAERFDGFRRFGRPPVLAPPAWALTSRIWDAIGVTREVHSTWGGPSPFGSVCELAATAGPSLVVVIPDGTRAGSWQSVLKDLVVALSEAVPATTRRTLLLAGGVHPVSPDTNLRAHLEGSGLSEKSLEGWSVIQNGDNGFRDHIEVGCTPSGTPVRLHPAYLAADFRLLLGEISWHYFAGFGGGRKLVFPGLADPAGVLANHRRAVTIRSGSGSRSGDPSLEDFAWNEACGPGLLLGNPVHEDLEAAIALAPPQWVVTTLDASPADPNPARPMTFPPEVVQGPYPASFEAAVARYEERHRIPFTARPAALIVDAGGRPRDQSFLQAHKSLQHGVRFLAPGGRLLVVAACEDGVGSETLRRYAADPVGYRPDTGRSDPAGLLHLQTLVALRRATTAVEIGLCSELPDQVVRSLGLAPLAGWNEAWAWLEEKGPANWGWLPRAELFLPERGLEGGVLS